MTTPWNDGVRRARHREQPPGEPRAAHGGGERADWPHPDEWPTVARHTDHTRTHPADRPWTHPPDRPWTYRADRTWTQRADPDHLAPPPAAQPVPPPPREHGRHGARHAARHAARRWHWAALLVVGLVATWALSAVALGDEPKQAGATAPAAQLQTSGCGGSSGPHLRAIYVRGDQQPDRLPAVQRVFGRVTGQIDALFAQAGVGGEAPAHFLRDAGCAAVIPSVVVPQVAMKDTASITAALRSLGFDAARGERYLYWYDAPGCTGTASTPGYAALGRDCWNLQSSMRELVRALA